MGDLTIGAARIWNGGQILAVKEILDQISSILI
jgi:hypothetical protein